MAPTAQKLSTRPLVGTLTDSIPFGVLVGGVWNRALASTIKAYMGTGPRTFTITGVGATIVDGTDDIGIVNTTVAGAGAQQYSPAIRQLGSGWKTDATAASQTVEFRAYVKTVQGSAAPMGNYTWESSINGGAYSEALNISSSGVMTVAGTISGSNLSGTNTGDQTITLTGDITGSGTGSFATTIVVGAVDIAMLSASGTPNGTTFLRGDNTWSSPSGSGDMILASVQTVTGAKTFESATFLLRNVADSFSVQFTNTVTSDRTYTLQDSAGTIAFTSDITGTNSGTNTGDQTITLTGGVTGSGTGSFATTVITNANLTGHITSTGNAAILGSFTVAQLSTALSDASISGTNTGDQTITLTGGVTGSGTGSFAATVVTNANLTGHITSTGNAAILGSFTVAQLSTALSDATISGSNTGDQTITLTGDVTGSGTGSFATTISAGAVDIAMLSATGTPDATTFLRGDNTWTTPAGSGDVTKVGIPVNNQIAVWTGNGTIEGSSAFLWTDIALVMRVAINDANPIVNLGATNLEELRIQSIYDTGAQTLDFVHFQTFTASVTADKGLYRFSVDASAIMDILDAGISVTGTGVFSGTVSGSNLSGSNTGDQTITLTGGVTGSGTGSFAATVITNANLTGHITSTGNATLLGSFTIAQLSTALSDATISGSNTGDQTITLTGDVTGSGTGSFATTIAVGAVDLAMLSATGTPTASNFLRGDNTWATPAGSGDMVLADPQTVTGAKTFNATTLLLRNVAGTFNGSFTNTNTADRIYTLQDAAGTVAFTSDITGTNSGTNTGDQTITLTGGVTGSGTGSFAATVITNANLTGHITSVGNAAILGSFTIAQLSTALSDATISGSNSGDQTITLTGNVTGSGTGSFAATIANDSVTYAKMQNISATARILGRNTTGAGDTEEIAEVQFKTLFNLEVGIDMGYLGVPQNSQSAAYTLILSDQGKHILHPSADTTARVFTIPANASVAYAIGTALTFVNQNSAGVITIAITTDILRLAVDGTTGSRTLAANGMATAVKVTATEWIIGGHGLT